MNNSFVKDRLDEPPLIAILRGLTPPEALDIGTALYESGIKVMEVTLNSPEPLKSIEILASHFEGKMAIGAGTVLNAEVIPKEVDLFAVGGVTDKNIKDWLNLDIKGVGLGSNLYAAGDSPEEAARKAKVMIALVNEL